MKTFLEPRDFEAAIECSNGRWMVKLDDRTVAYLTNSGTLGSMRYFYSASGPRSYLFGMDPEWSLPVDLDDPWEMSQLLRLPDFGGRRVCANCGCGEVRFTPPVDVEIPPKSSM